MLDQVATNTARTNLAPIPFECDAPFLKVTGELPRELNGTLYRNGPNPQFDAPGAHWFVGDGMLHAFRLENGRASYRNRWVRTPKWQAEHDAGRALFGGFGRKLPDAPPSTITDGGVANTNIIFHAGRLLALEEGHPPTEIEPDTLNRIGYCDYKGAISGPFTAHPKIDPVTGEMVFFGYNAAGPLTPALSFGSVNASGVVTRFDRFEAPYASMVHDFIVTEHHLLFPILPITGSMDRAMRGKPPYAWEPDKGAYVGVMKRSGSAKDIVWFRAENCYVFHVMNAWEEGDRIIADVMQFEEATAGTPAPIRICRCSARCRASCMSTARARGLAIICCPPATRFRSRCSSSAAAMPPRGMAGCWPRSGASGKTAAIWRCSMLPMSKPARWRWCISAIACPMVFTAIGSGRSKGLAPSFRGIAQD